MSGRKPIGLTIPYREVGFKEKKEKREWVGLTDIEYSILAEQYTGADGLDCVDYGRAVEAKLKEKNI